eukprot:CAMPEP_0194363982 /NCGR_PEP_ID=MMETSP0174-20130528/11860_1 /TAXON_ID=216777 /ORGANISM="Proboscia alata, Strain PI-D3" /LENGTH=413 /DNA_ID=CAMNT_0039137751 /DNA_START=53 /DNA_END=1294 /DNA_ORIENTATION=-
MMFIGTTRTIAAVFILVCCVSVDAFVPSTISNERACISRVMVNRSSNNDETTTSNRRSVLRTVAAFTLFSPISVLAAPDPAFREGGIKPLPSGSGQRAVGSFEKKCQKEGNCLQKLDIDGAVGWDWGAKDRCNANDANCGLDGKLRSEEELMGAVVPSGGGEITDVVTMTISIGRNENKSLKLGLYGKQCPLLAAQFLELCGGGIISSSKLALEEGYGITSNPVSMGGNNGGALNLIYPAERLDFGIASQSIAYAKARGLVKAGENFAPQPRPTKDLENVENEPSARSHIAAGLLSVPSRGIGYGGNTQSSDDEAYASSFQITTTSVSKMDSGEKRKVIGQIMDEDSMAVLSRLAVLPTQKGFKGIIPGQSYGPPLFKVVVRGVTIDHVVPASPETVPEIVSETVPETVAETV